MAVAMEPFPRKAGSTGLMLLREAATQRSLRKGRSDALLHATLRHSFLTCSQPELPSVSLSSASDIRNSPFLCVSHPSPSTSRSAHLRQLTRKLYLPSSACKLLAVSKSVLILSTTNGTVLLQARINNLSLIDRQEQPVTNARSLRGVKYKVRTMGCLADCILILKRPLHIAGLANLLRWMCLGRFWTFLAVFCPPSSSETQGLDRRRTKAYRGCTLEKPLTPPRIIRK